jgi:tripartite ATP-independent transporter DctM subunit
MLVAVLLISLLIFIAMGVPIAIALAGSSLLYIVLSGTIPEIAVIHRIVNGVDSFPLLAVPFFIMAGNLMNSSGITERLFSFAKAAVGWARGGLGHVNVVGSTIEIKAMRDQGYDVRFAVGITAASSTLGPIIPPSLPLVIYGVVASASIGQLFLAGIVPGLVMAVLMMITVVWYARMRNYPRDQNFSFGRLWTSFVASFLPLLTPAIIIGGMVFGLFTPTEAAIAACVWAMFLGFVVYRTLNLRKLIRISMDTIETTAVVLFIVGGASIFGWILTTSRVTEEFAEALLSLSRDPVVILILINLLLLVVGCFMETIAAITILTPVLLPVAVAVGVDPVQFGIIMVLNLMIGLLTPPVGMVLYVLARVANISFEECMRACLPFIVPLLVALGLITFIPALTLWLPTLIFR